MVIFFSAVVHIDSLQGNYQENIDRDYQAVKPCAQVFRLRKNSLEKIDQHVNHDDGYHADVKQPLAAQHLTWGIILNYYLFG